MTPEEVAYEYQFNDPEGFKKLQEARKLRSKIEHILMEEGDLTFDQANRIGAKVEMELLEKC